jgi:hypothetical protein
MRNSIIDIVCQYIIEIVADTEIKLISIATKGNNWVTIADFEFFMEKKIFLV